MFTVLAIVFGVFWGGYFSWLLKKAQEYISKELLEYIMTGAHFVTALAALNFVVLFYSHAIALRVAVFLSDYLGVWIVKYTSGEWLLAIAGHLGETAKALFDYAALAHPVHPAVQAVAVLLLTQMLVFEFLSREKR